MRHPGHPEAAAEIVAAIERVLKESDVKTPDMGAKAYTKAFGQATLDAQSCPPLNGFASKGGWLRLTAPSY